VLGIPGVAGDRGVVVGKGSRFGLAQEDRPRLPEPGDDRGVLGGDMRGIDRCAAAGVLPPDVDDVLHADGYPVERPLPVPSLELAVAAACLREGLFFIHLDPGMDDALPGLDPLQARFHKPFCRQLAAFHPGDGFLDGHVSRFTHCFVS